MVGRSRARYLAPIALAAVIVGRYLAVHAGLSTNHSVAHNVGRQPNREQRTFARVKFYVVKPGDSLTRIAQQTGIPISTLDSLNRTVDPNALQTGQRLRLRR